MGATYAEAAVDAENAVSKAANTWCGLLCCRCRQQHAWASSPDKPQVLGVDLRPKLRQGRFQLGDVPRGWAKDSDTTLQNGPHILGGIQIRRVGWPVHRLQTMLLPVRLSTSCLMDWAVILNYLDPSPLLTHLLPKRDQSGL